MNFFPNEADREPNNSYEDKLEGHYKFSGILILVLSCLRLISLDFFNIISDLITVCMIYCAYMQKSKLMAIFCLVNGVIGTLFAGVAFFRIISFLTGKFYTVIVFLIILYAMLCYLYLGIISYFAMTYYTRGCPCDQNNASNPNNFNSYNSSGERYGGINQPNQANQEETGTKFAAFTGKGVTVG